jgi:hypothetical protein
LGVANPIHQKNRKGHKSEFLFDKHKREHEKKDINERKKKENNISNKKD